MDVSLYTLLLYILLVGLFIFILFCIILKLTTKPYPYVYRSKNETYFTDVDSGETILFPSLKDEPTVNLSVIVPAYNEEVRLPPMLKECLEYLEDKAKSNSFTYEVIIVSDGSSDGTVSVAQQYAKKNSNNKIKILELETNRGKGGAVRLGMLSARGALLLFADADGATKFSDLSKLESSLNQTLKVNCAGWWM